jgi:tRNA C32,U32 (ribose-2'-O)-methylase TrmJ
VAYELRLAALSRRGEGGAPDASGGEPPAVAAEVEAAVRDLRSALVAIGYLDPMRPDSVLTELRRLVVRARPTTREVTLLRGVARQVAWAGRVAKGGPGVR